MIRDRHKLFGDTVNQKSAFDQQLMFFSTSTIHSPYNNNKSDRNISSQNPTLPTEDAYQFPHLHYKNIQSLLQNHKDDLDLLAKLPAGQNKKIDKCKESTYDNSLIDKYLPTKLIPYALLARLDKPIGTWLLYLPCSLFGVGSLVLRGSGCVINDLWDVNIDRKVERTRNRPLASGLVTPFQALVFLGLQLSVGLSILLQLNWHSLVTIYPFMKRITYWPQLFLGWSAMAEEGIDLSVTLPLYGAGVFWTLTYDTIYAHQSTALLFNNNSRLWLSLFSGSMISCLILSGYMNDQGLPYYLLSCMGASIHSIWQLKTVDFDNVVDCGKKFKSNKWLGIIVLSGIVSDIAWKNYKKKINYNNNKENTKNNL
nr:3953_t:CDS:2 [Entrophospora candida]